MKMDQELIHIPTGFTFVGSTRPEEGPSLQVEVAAFDIDRFAVSNEAFSTFVAAGGYYNSGLWSAEGWNWVKRTGTVAPAFALDERFNQPRQPALACFFEATAYASFIGGHLPSEIQFERAARGGDRRCFPWGDDEPTFEHANFAPYFSPSKRAALPVDACPLGDSPFGCRQMAGNVHEWVSDFFHRDTPTGRTHGNFVELRPSPRRVLKGGAWTTDASRLWISARWSYVPDLRDNIIGFRVAYPIAANTGKERSNANA